MFASSAVGGSVADLNIGNQLWLQMQGVVATLAYSGVVTFILITVVDSLIGIRVTDDEETTSLDLSLHNEQGFNLEFSWGAAPASSLAAPPAPRSRGVGQWAQRPAGVGFGRSPV